MFEIGTFLSVSTRKFFSLKLMDNSKNTESRIEIFRETSNVDILEREKLSILLAYRELRKDRKTCKIIDQACSP